MTQRKQFNIALSDWQISEIERQSKLLGIRKTELVVRWVTQHIREEHDKNVKPVFTEAPTQPEHTLAVEVEPDAEIDNMIANMFKRDGT